jgi:hypothetical protein
MYMFFPTRHNCFSGKWFLLLCAAVIISLMAADVRADFISLNPLCRHITSADQGSAGVVILPNTSANTGPAGLLIYSTQKSIPAQGFSIRSIPAKDSVSIFLKFNRETKRFSDLIISGGRQYRLEGNISLELKNIRINVSYENNYDVYTSVVFKPDASVIALSGLEPMIVSKGETLVTWLGQDSVAASEVMKVAPGGSLQIGEAPFQGDKIGLPNQNLNQNICMNTGTIYMSPSAFAELEKRVMLNQSAVVERRALVKKSSDFLVKNSVLVMLAQGIVVQDGYGQLLTVKPAASKLFDDQIICLVEGLS